MELNDAELLELWRQGDMTAGEALFDRYYDAVERFFLNKLPREAADLVQDTFVACVEGRDRVQDSTKFGPYLFSIAWNVLRRYLRRSYRSGQELDLDGLSIHDVSPSPGTLLGHRREQRLLLEALRHLPLEYQVILELHYWEQMTTDNIAVSLQLPVGTVRSRLIRARTLLEEAMGRLALSREELESTLTQLDDWAERCRADMLAVAASRVRKH